MDAAHLHLLLNHVPVIGLVFSWLLLAYGLVARSEDVTKASFWALGLVALAAAVVYLTGEPAEELIEGLPGFSEAAMERHEAAALWATWAAVAAGAVALGGLYMYRGIRVPRRFGVFVLVLSLVALVPMAWTANLGGQVRHEEIRGGSDGPAAPGGQEAEELPDQEEARQGRQEGRSGPSEAQPPRQEDTRRPVVVPGPARATVLAEMRQMLEALNGVLAASVPFDRGAVREAALSGGTRIAVDRDPAMAERLPEAFVELGASTHRGFDALAERVAEGAPRDTVLSRLADLTAKCVACHATYRLETPD